MDSGSKKAFSLKTKAFGPERRYRNHSHMQGGNMLEDLKEVILNLEKSLDLLVHDEQTELLKQPEYLEAMRDVVQSINQVTQTLKKLEASSGEGRKQDQEQQADKKQISGSAERTLRVVGGKSKDRRTSSC